jgi:hypothetical protein
MGMLDIYFTPFCYLNSNLMFSETKRGYARQKKAVC